MFKHVCCHLSKSMKEDKIHGYKVFKEFSNYIENPGMERGHCVLLNRNLICVVCEVEIELSKLQ